MRERVRAVVVGCVLVLGCGRVSPRVSVVTATPGEPVESVVAGMDRPVSRAEAKQQPRRAMARTEAELQEALALDVRDAGAYEGLARLYYERSKTRPSYAILARQVIAQGTAMLAREGQTSADLLATRGLLVLDAGRPDLALRDLIAAVELDPGNLRAQAALGRLALAVNDEPRARAAFQAIVGTPEGQEDAAAWRGLALLEVRVALREYRSEALDAAQAALRRAAEAAPLDPRIQYELARLADFRADAALDNKIPTDTESQRYYRRFMALAGDDPRFAAEREVALARIAAPKYWSCSYPIGTFWGTEQEHRDFDERHAGAAAAERAMAAEQAARQAAERERMLELERKALAAEAAETLSAQ